MFLDEPTTGLDPESRFRFWSYLRRQNARGMTIVATTHYMEEAREYCDSVLLMNEGRVVTSGPPERLIEESGLAAPRSPAASGARNRRRGGLDGTAGGSPRSRNRD